MQFQFFFLFYHTFLWWIISSFALVMQSLTLSHPKLRQSRQLGATGNPSDQPCISFKSIYSVVPAWRQPPQGCRC